MITTLPIAAISPSSTNPRKHFDPNALADLQASIAKHGILQPLLVRPLPKNPWFVEEVFIHGKNKRTVYQVINRTLIKDRSYKGQTPIDYTTREEAEANMPSHELIAGERRLRAAQAAGLTEVPAIVLELDDKAALEVQVVENLQRADLHPIEEAEGYHALMMQHAYTAEDIAAKVGKSKAYVYSRLKLTALCPEAKNAMWKGDLSPSVALLLARLPSPEAQQDALENVIDMDGNPISFRNASQFIQRTYMCRLKEAPFSTKDGNLLPGAPACVACPHRTGNQKELFADVDSADVCTNPDCYRRKREAHNQQLLEKAKAKGKAVLEGGEVFDSYGYLKGREYVDLAREEYAGDKYQSWKKHLGKQCPEVVLAVDPKGEVHELVKRSDAVAVLKQAGKLDEQEEQAAPAVDRKAELREQRIQRLYEWKVTEAVLDEVVLHNAIVASEVWRFLAWGAFQYTDISKHAEAAKRRGLAKTQNEARPAIEAWIADDNRTALELSGMVVELLCLAKPWNEDRWTQLCRVAGVDLTELQKQAEDEVNKTK